ncbi:hypothetical protein P7H46_06630 [Enterococcus pseudoavium]|uniref:Uncharacterized protein n=1 Tax=Enterococcus pseudoavium TaxID=44007 RepID=A0ABU3FI64_9ENTE|nr:hypothetical protein [Enterococcus pseudoavium]MDT2770519.1 hypothetical protein [Enterococcus pseudoavium]
MFSNEEMKYIREHFDEDKKIAADSGFPFASDLDEIEQQFREFDIDRKFQNREERRKALKLQKRMKRKRK